MRHAVTDLGAFGVVETVQGADKVTRNTADALELHAVADLPVHNGKMVELSHGCCVHFQFLRVGPADAPLPCVIRRPVRFPLPARR